MIDLGLRRGQIWLLGTGLVLGIVSWMAFQPWNPAVQFMTGAPFGRDFINFWVGPRLALEGRADVLGDLGAYNAVIEETFGLDRPTYRVFSYPPTILAPLVPFALLPYVPALLLFTAVNLVALAAALRLCWAGAATPRRGLVALTLLSPPAAAMVMFGHFGGLLALAATAALIEMDRRPWITGLCLAAISAKPQMALVLGLILLGAGRWRWLPAAAAGTLALNALSVAAFGLQPWRVFFEVTVPIQSAFLTDFRPQFIATVCSVFFTARYWGMAAEPAWSIQVATSALCLVTGVLALRRGRLDPGRLCIVLLSTLMAMPYVAHYDLAVAAPALTLLAADRAIAPRASPIVVFAWLLVPLARILTALDVPALSLVLLAVLATLVRPLLRTGTDAEPGASGSLVQPC